MRVSASPNPASFRLPSSSLPPKRLGLLPSSPTFVQKSKVFSSKCLAGGDRSPPKEQSPKTNLDHCNQAQGGREEEDRHVRCDVDVVSWRERRIKARILVDADIEAVWSVLTDYERLADFIPNLVCSERIPCPHQGRIWLEQRGLQRALYWHIEARVVLDLQELPDSANGRELHFSMVDGDFKKFEGKWSVKAGPRSSAAILSYEVNVIPTFNFPAIFLERIITSDLPVNLRALACRAERNSEENQKMLIARNSVGASSRSDNPSSLGLSGAACETDALSSNKLREKYASSAFSTMLGSPSTEFNSKWGVYGKVCRLDRRCMVDEVHLRRFDGLLENGGAHRCVIASITVKAPIREVWNVLTTYEALPEIVPNLAISKILSRDNNKVRILQEGCKGLLYMVLHARVVLDLHEELEREISFEQVEGDFDSFQGKWLLEQLGDQHTLLKYIVESKMHKDTFLSEAILEEVSISSVNSFEMNLTHYLRNCGWHVWKLFQVIYEDLPSNLCAIRDFVEKREAAGNKSPKYPDKLVVPVSNYVHVIESKPAEQVSTSDVSAAPLRQRPKVPGLQRDIEVLKAELMSFISRYGQDGFMPMRKQLRMHGRVDIEKAITRMGGFRKIANMMNLSLAYKRRKPSGYWDNLENLQEEIRRFQKNWGMDPAYMPSRKSFERAGRYDIARALEKWGGLQEVSRLLSLKLRHPRRHLDLDSEGQHDFKAPSEPDGEEKISSKPYIPQDTEKWFMKLKDLDINWVE